MLNLNDKRIMEPNEAAERWGLKDTSTIRRAKDKFPPGTIRKFGKQWIVTADGMKAVFGDEIRS